MSITRKGIALLIAAALLVVMPAAAAQALTKDVSMGVPPPAAKTLGNKYGADVNDFFPHGITIHKGDSVRFLPSGFHTVDFPTKGAGILPIFTATDTQVTGVNDAAGNPFWFNGQVPQQQLNPALLSSNFGKKLRYTSKHRIDTGLPIADKPKPMVVKFRKSGTFTYLCDVHPGMKGVVHVVRRGRSIPGAKRDRRTVDNQVNRAVSIAKALNATKAPDGVIDVGSGGKHGVEVFKFFPGAASVPVGTTLRFQMTTASLEAHTATIGPDDPGSTSPGYLHDLSASFLSPAPDPRALYPSEVPGGAVGSVTPSSHGNGFWNAGVIDNDSNSPPPTNNSVRFDAPGTYNVYCLIHPFMHGVITVQ